MSVLLRPKLPRSHKAFGLTYYIMESIDCWHSATSAERRAVDSPASSAARDPCQWPTLCTVVGRINYAAPAKQLEAQPCRGGDSESETAQMDPRGRAGRMRLQRPSMLMNLSGRRRAGSDCRQRLAGPGSLGLAGRSVVTALLVQAPARRADQRRRAQAMPVVAWGCGQRAVAASL